MKTVIHYWKNIKMLTFFQYNKFEGEDRPIFLFKELKGGYAPVDTTSHTDKDTIFAIYNTERNPLATLRGQKNLKALNVGHTSMSVGDIIQIDGIDWVCLPYGFKKINWIGR